MAEDRKDIGALWIATDRETGAVKKDKHGNVMLVGKIDGKGIRVIRNSFKKPGEKSPDYRVFPIDDNYGGGGRAQDPLDDSEGAPF